MILLADIYSSFNKSHLYGQKGEKVKLIAERGTVLIVENKNGKRFPVNKEKVMIN